MSLDGLVLILVVHARFCWRVRFGHELLLVVYGWDRFWMYVAQLRLWIGWWWRFWIVVVTSYCCAVLLTCSDEGVVEWGKKLCWWWWFLLYRFLIQWRLYEFLAVNLYGSFLCVMQVLFIVKDFGQGFVAENLHFGLRWESLFLDSCCGWGWEGWRRVTACVLWFGLGQKNLYLDYLIWTK